MFNVVDPLPGVQHNVGMRVKIGIERFLSQIYLRAVEFSSVGFDI